MKKQGFSKTERLLSPYQFKNVYQQRRVVKDPFFWLYRAPNALAYNRLGISVSNRTCKNIAERNKIKRIIREVFQNNKDCFGKGQDLVIVLKRKLDKTDLKDIENKLLGLAKK